MRLMVFPRDANPYQELLYNELEQLGVSHSYVGERTKSQTLNLMLLPFELAIGRWRGAKGFHLHWVFGFAIPVIGEHALVRRLMRWYFVALLELCRLLGVGVVWTAHNTVPHRPVFDDDQLGRRQLTARCVAVIAHSAEARKELLAMGCVLPATAIIPPGPPALSAPPDPEQPRATNEQFRIVFAGKVVAYKGVEELLDVLASEDIPADATYVIAGECDDPDLAQRLVVGASRSRVPVDLRLSFLREDDFENLLTSADAVVLPFRRTTSSSSVLMSLGAGTPVIIPDLPALADVPADCVWRYDGTLAGLAKALREAVATPLARRREMSQAGLAHARSGSWAAAASATRDLLQRVGIT